MSKKTREQKGHRKKTVKKKIKAFFGVGLKTIDVKCPYCSQVFDSMMEMGIHLKEEHCR